MTLMTVMVMILVKWWCEGFSPWEILGNIALVPSPSHPARPHFADDQDDQWSSCWKRSMVNLNLKQTFKILQPLHFVVQITQWTLFHLIFIKHNFYLLSIDSVNWYSFVVVQICQSPLFRVKLISVGINLIWCLWVSCNDFSNFINLFHSYS